MFRSIFALALVVVLAACGASPFEPVVDSSDVMVVDESGDMRDPRMISDTFPAAVDPVRPSWKLPTINH